MRSAVQIKSTLSALCLQVIVYYARARLCSASVRWKCELSPLKRLECLTGYTDAPYWPATVCTVHRIPRRCYSNGTWTCQSEGMKIPELCSYSYICCADKHFGVDVIYSDFKNSIGRLMFQAVVDESYIFLNMFWSTRQLVGGKQSNYYKNINEFVNLNHISCTTISPLRIVESL